MVWTQIWLNQKKIKSLEDTTGFWGSPPNGKGDVPVLRSTNLRDNGTLDYSKIAYRSFPEEKIVQKTLYKNDILLERSGGGPNTPVGRIAYFDGEGTYCFNNFMQRLRPDLKVCNGKFLAYSLWAFHAQGKTSLIQQATTGIRNLNYKEYLAWPILVPPLPEQKKIASILSSVDDTIQATQAVIDQTRRVKQGMLQQLLTRGIGHTRFKQTEIGEIPATWITGEVGDFLKLQRGFDITQKQVIPGEVPVISSSGISYYHNQSMIEPPGVITGRKGKLGKVYFVDIPYWPHDTSLFVKDFKGNDPRFIFWVLIGLKLEKLDAATAVPTLNRNTVHKIKIAIPPIDEQKNIVKILDSIINTTIYQKKEMDVLNVLKHGLMQDLLTGRVRVKPDEVNTT